MSSTNPRFLSVLGILVLLVGVAQLAITIAISEQNKARKVTAVTKIPKITVNQSVADSAGRIETPEISPLDRMHVVYLVQDKDSTISIGKLCQYMIQNNIDTLVLHKRLIIAQPADICFLRIAFIMPDNSFLRLSGNVKMQRTK